MESPVVVDKPPEYHGNDNDRGFPFDEEEGSGAWSELAARHPDIAARLRQHPATWARKRRPSSQDNDDFGDSFSGFDRFPFDEIPPEFRGHFPSHWNRRFGSREEQVPQQAQTSSHQHPPPSSPQQQTTATQTEPNQPPEPEQQTSSLPQYGLRNTVDLGQKSAVDPSLVNADDRNQRSMSAPPESNANHTKMSGQNHQEPSPHSEQPQPQTQSKVRNIPIFVEGRDHPVINETVDHPSHFGEPKPTYVPHQQPPLDSTYFTEEGPINFNHPPNFTRAFGTPFANKPYRQGQPFAQQKVYPQSATNFARGASPQRSQSPKPQPHEEFIKVPVQHEAPKPQQQARQEPPRPQPKPQPQQHQQHPQQHQQHPQPPPPPQQKQQTPPPEPKPQATSPADPITQILAIQTDVLNLMTEVEKFTGTKKDKRYLFLDEMLTRNLIKLDNIETEGKENIRNARKEAIRCIQKCIAVLEAKADNKGASTPQPQENQEAPAPDVDMNSEQTEQGEKATNGEVDMKEPSKDEASPEQQAAEPAPAVTAEATPQTADTRPEEKAPEPEAPETKEDNVDKKTKKVVKNVKKRDKSKDKAPKGEAKEVKENAEAMQVDDKGDKPEQSMEVDGAASQ